MISSHPTHSRILGIAVTGRGFGFAVIEDHAPLVDWGIKSTRASSRDSALGSLRNLIVQYQPDRLVLEDIFAPGCRKSPRIRDLICHFASVANDLQVDVECISRADLIKVLCAHDKATKHDARVVVCQTFPLECGDQVVARRQPWESEDFRFQFYDAVAFALGSIRKRSR